MLLRRTLPATALLTCAALAHAQAPRVIAIGQVQGTGTASPLVGQTVTVEGVVTADFPQGLGGFFLQDGGDGDPASSDAVFVPMAFDANADDGEVPQVGQRYRVRGEVTELELGRQGSRLTAITADDIERLGGAASVPAPVVLAAAPADWEALEGMRVRIGAPLTVSGTDQVERFGELTTAFEGRLWQPSEVAAPGSEAFQRVLEDNARRRLTLDDGSGERDPKSIGWLGTQPVPRVGTVLEDVEGIVDERHGSHRLQLTGPLALPTAAYPLAPRVPGTLKIAAFNLENLFNGDGRGGGFPTPRGAKTPAQLQAQLAKLVATVRALDADVAALMELENDGYGPESSLAQFVAALNARGGDWRFVDAGEGPGPDTIRVGLIYRASRVTPVGKPATLTGGPFGDRSRVPLAQAFRRGQGPAFVVVANHFKSKGCSEATGADQDQGDTQGCWNALRLDSAHRLDAWLKQDPTGQGSAMKVILGDFNAYAMEDPVRWLREAGWRDAFAVAKVKQPYSYVYNGLTGRLDHALLSPALAGRLRGAAEWHLNADSADSAGYPHGDPAQPWRSSDHDPLLLGFDL
nr:ExeM/NucH family extracellular endonuclease [Pseudoxanthomonas sp.]